MFTFHQILLWFHTGQLISRLNSVCYAIRAVTAMLSRKALRILHFPYVHSIISYTIILGGNTPNSVKIFKLKKKETNLKKMDSCTELFKTIEILASYSQYLFLFYVVNNKHLFSKNLNVLKHNTRSSNNLHLPK